MEDTAVHATQTNMNLSTNERESVIGWIPLYLEKDMLTQCDQFADFIVGDRPELFFVEHEISIIFKDNIKKWIRILEKEIFSVDVYGEFIYSRLERWRLVNLLALRSLMKNSMHLRCPRMFENYRYDIIYRNKSSGSLKFCIPDDSFFDSFSNLIYMDKANGLPMRSRNLLPSTSLYPFRFFKGATEHHPTDGGRTRLESFQIGSP